jgi:hypothetical protein
MPRSLNEPVGFMPSNLKYRSTPSFSPRRSERTSGVDPSPNVIRGVFGPTGRRSA